MFTLDLPKPPSVNSANKYGRGGVYPSKAKKAWFDEAGWIIKEQKPKPKPVKGPFRATITITRKGRKPKQDLDNLPKYVLDLLQLHRLIENDCLLEGMNFTWGMAHLGCCVHVHGCAA